MSIPYAVTEVLDRYLDYLDRITPGTGTGLADAPEPLPFLKKGVPLYDVTDPWITETWGGPSSMPLKGKAAWSRLLIASRKYGDKNAALKEWAQWLRELDERQWAAKSETPPPDPTTTLAEQYVTLDQMAALVNRAKKTLERKANAKNGDMPTPDVEGGGGKPHEWKWSTVRPWLEKQFKRQLPERFPR